MSIVMKRASFVEITLLKSIFATNISAVRVITNPDMDCIKLEVATFKFGDQMTGG
jgi:hypothetical protein